MISQIQLKQAQPEDASYQILRNLFGVIRSDYVLMVQAFFDESGTHDGAIVTCVAGYLFEPDQCLRFDDEWREALAAAGLKYFHMEECAHGVAQFKGWPKPKRVEIQTKLIGIIKRRAAIGVVVSVCQQDYATVAAPGLSQAGGAYVLCLMWCLAGVSAWVNRHNFQGSIAYFFEAGHRLQSHANRAMNSLASNPILSAQSRYGGHAFLPKDLAEPDKRLVRPLQAADLLAWQWHKDWDNRFGPTRRGRRLDLDSLLALPHMHSHLSRANLEAMAVQAAGGLPEDFRHFGFLE
jgi:hypothetical protein